MLYLKLCNRTMSSLFPIKFYKGKDGDLKVAEAKRPGFKTGKEFSTLNP